MTGIEMIAQERKEQIEKHGRTVESDVNNNPDGVLRLAARELITFIRGTEDRVPDGWDKDIWEKMAKKNVIERLVIAGALIAAEIDRLNF